MYHIHDVLHVSMLKKFIPHPSHIIKNESIVIDKDLSYMEELTQIFDKKEKILRNRIIPLVKVNWKHHYLDETTWELEEEIKNSYPHIFID